MLVTNVQTINAPVSPTDEDDDEPTIAQVTGHAVRRHARPLARGVGAIRLRQRVRPRVALPRPRHRRRRRHPTGLPRNVYTVVELMSDQTPVVTIGPTCRPSCSSTCRPPCATWVSSRQGRRIHRHAATIQSDRRRLTEGRLGKTAVSSNLVGRTRRTPPGPSRRRRPRRPVRRSGLALSLSARTHAGATGSIQPDRRDHRSSST